MRIGDYIVDLHTYQTYRIEIIEYASNSSQVMKFMARDSKQVPRVYEVREKDETWTYPIV